VLLKGFKEMEIAGPHADNWLPPGYNIKGWEGMDHLPLSSSLVPSDFHLFGPVEQ